MCQCATASWAVWHFLTDPCPLLSHLRMLYWLFTTGLRIQSLVCGSASGVLLCTITGRSGYQLWRWLCSNCGVPSPPRAAEGTMASMARSIHGSHSVTVEGKLPGAQVLA